MRVLNISPDGQEELELFQTLVEKGAAAASVGLIEDVDELLLLEVLRVHNNESGAGVDFSDEHLECLREPLSLLRDLWKILTSLMIAPSQHPEEEPEDILTMSFAGHVSSMAFIGFFNGSMDLSKKALAAESQEEKERLRSMLLWYCGIIEAATGYRPDQLKSFCNDNMPRSSEMTEFFRNSPL